MRIISIASSVLLSDSDDISSPRSIFKNFFSFSLVSFKPSFQYLEAIFVGADDDS